MAREKWHGQGLAIAAGEMGPISRDESRASAVRRMTDMMRQAKRILVELMVFPELALTTYFPMWFIEDQAEIDFYFEREMPNEYARPLFGTAAESEMGFYLGYAEISEGNGETRRYNAAILVDASGAIISKYQITFLVTRSTSPGVFSSTWRSGTFSRGTRYSGVRRVRRARGHVRSQRPPVA